MADPETHGRDAAAVASGSSITLLGILADRGLRWIINFLLTWVLGSTALYGLYAATTKALVPILASTAGLGLDTGIVFFDARYRQASDPGRIKGVLLLGAGMSLLSGLLAGALALVLPDMLCGTTVALEALCSDGPEVQIATRWGAVLVALWTFMLYLLGALQARKDMRSRVIAFQIVVPVVFLAGVVLSWLVGVSLRGVLIAYAVAMGAGMVVALQRTWRHYGPLLRDPAIKAKFEVGEVLRFSLPQSLAGLVFRLNLQLGLLMLTALASAEQAGLYDVAVGLAVLGSLPVNAVITMFNPMISALFASGEQARMDALLKTVSRWLVVLALPVYLPLMLLPDVLLSIYRPEYQASTWPLVVLCVGQLVNAACAPSMRLIPMSGHTLLNFINGVVAATLNVGLCWVLIPLYGGMGAALATSITLVAWGLWRVAEVWWMFRCFPFTPKTLALLGFAGVSIPLVWIASLSLEAGGGGVLLRAVAAVLLLVIYGALAWLLGREPEDRIVLDRFRKRLQRRWGSRTG